MRVYRASGLGGCMKAQVAAQSGFTPLDTEKQMSDMAREGQLHEDEVIMRLEREQGIKVYGRQREVVLKLLSDVMVEGHIDGETADELVEIKSMSPDQFKIWLDKRWDAPGFVQKYKWQISVYMMAAVKPMMFIVKNRSSGRLDITRITTPFYDKDQILARVLEIEKWVRRGELPDECDVNMFPCPFYYLEQEIQETVEDEELDRVARVYDEARKEKQKAEQEVKEAKKLLDTTLAGRQKVVTGQVRVTYYETKRMVIDKEKMKENGIDVEQFERPQMSKALRVTIKKEDEDDGENEPRRDSG